MPPGPEKKNGPILKFQANAQPKQVTLPVNIDKRYSGKVSYFRCINAGTTEFSRHGF